MNENKIKIGSNRSFGIVFFIVFFIISLFPLLKGNDIRIWSLLVSLIFLLLGLINSNILSPLNKLWFKFGLLLGNFISPIVMGLVFFFSCYTNWFIYETYWKRFVKFKQEKRKILLD